MPGIGKIAVLTEYMAAKFSNETSYSTDSAFHSVSVAIDQFNDDNRLDLVIANQGTDHLQIFFALKNEIFDRPITYLLDENSDPQYVISMKIIIQILSVSIHRQIRSVSLWDMEIKHFLKN